MSEYVEYNTTEEYNTIFGYELYICLSEFHPGFIVLCTTYLLCMLLCIPAKAWFLWVSLRAGWKIKPTQVLPLNLTILELIACLELGVELLNFFILTDSYVFTNFIYMTLWTCRPLIQMCICIEHYLAVVHPVTFLRYKGIIYRSGAAVVAWLIASGYALYASLETYPEVFSASFFIIVLIVISFCCVSVLLVLKHSGPGDRNLGNQQKSNAFKTIFFILVTVLLGYLPLVGIAIICVSKLYNLNYMMFSCDIFPSMSAFNTYSVIIPTMLKFYKEVNLQCKNSLRNM